VDLRVTGLGFLWIGVFVFGGLYFLNRNRNFAARHGRTAVNHLIERRGQTLISLQARPVGLDPKSEGLSRSTMLFDAVVRDGGGDHRTYRLAFDPTGANGARPGLKQLDDGVWRDAT
jgi:hypothetical protein